MPVFPSLQLASLLSPALPALVISSLICHSVYKSQDNIFLSQILVFHHSAPSLKNHQRFFIATRIISDSLTMPSMVWALPTQSTSSHTFSFLLTVSQQLWPNSSLWNVGRICWPLGLCIGRFLFQKILPLEFYLAGTFLAFKSPFRCHIFREAFPNSSQVANSYINPIIFVIALIKIIHTWLFTHLVIVCLNSLEGKLEKQNFAIYMYFSILHT